MRQPTGSLRSDLPVPGIHSRHAPERVETVNERQKRKTAALAIEGEDFAGCFASLPFGNDAEDTKGSIHRIRGAFGSNWSVTLSEAILVMYRIAAMVCRRSGKIFCRFA